jgi:hypothetical protein
MSKRSDKTDAADIAHGGPGSEHNSRSPRQYKRDDPLPGQPTNPNQSRVSGGGGERDRHHSHDPAKKS